MAIERPTMAKKAHVSHNSGNDEWHTPIEYVDAARRVMGGIDCDPASSEKANEAIRASVFYSKDDDALFKTWRGRVWMNCPYSRSLVELFTQTVVRQFVDGTVTEAIVLVNNATDTRWYQYLVDAATCVCLVRGRIHFVAPDGLTRNSPLQGQHILYLGPNGDAFAREFARFGTILWAHPGGGGYCT
jgi:phage N-6-adenine-methyltransferase